ncbi:integrator complex subunit 8 [Centruroides vittatus]|uniref:integrator complex subunit 8 n=1 Tax=Centruroides vittatus TaxID=120091 RepID=UPI003510970A
MNRSNPASSRPSTPAKILWFEFLLEPSLLEKHLALPNPDPPVTELIIQFLTNVSSSSSLEQNSNTANVNLSTSNAGGVSTQDPENITSKLSSEQEAENKKSLALKLLALKAAAFLKWNLNLLEKVLPLPIQENLIKDLQKILSSSDCESVEQMDKESLLPDILFANILYYRWNLRAVIKSSYPVRGQKGLTVQIPGQVDPTFVPQDVTESIIRKLSEQCDQSCKLLEEVLKKEERIRMPLMNCLGTVSEEAPNPNHNWKNGILLNKEEIQCQLSYDLGCYYFHREEYKKAGEYFTNSSSLYPKMKNSLYCQIDEAKLKGYFNAVAHLTKRQSSLEVASLQERLQKSLINNYEDLANILMEDNIKRQIPLALRDALEMEILQDGKSTNEMYFKVIVLNAVRRVIAAELVHMNFQIEIKNNENIIVDTLSEAMKMIFINLTNVQKSLMKNFIRMLYHSSGNIASQLKKNDVVKNLFDRTEIDNLYKNKLKTDVNKELLLSKQNFTDDISVVVGQLERELLSASSPKVICSLVKRLQSISSKPLSKLYHKWELPRHIASLVRNVQSSEVIYILLAKAKELRTVKNYTRARELYRMIQDELRSGASRLNWLIGWELLHTDLLEAIETPIYKFQDPKQCQEIIQKAKSCIKSYYQERETPPDVFLVDLSAIVLLNLRDWDTLNEIEGRQDGYVGLSCLLSSVCRDICANKGSRTSARDLWDAVLPIFSNINIQHKRSNSGIIKEMQREAMHGIVSRSHFLHFTGKLVDTLVLTVVISCLSKLYNILKDNSNGEIFLEYSALWPAVVSNSSTFSVQAVGDALHEVLGHALTIHPTHSSWLKTRGDFMYVRGHHAAATKYYLSAAMVSSDYFSQPLPRALFDDAQYKHMIHCCTKLQCHTQAAVLGQCVEDPAYSAIFKSLGEKICNDSCDTFYPCIWDVTLLEYLINLHARRGEVDRRQLAIHLIGQLELNSNNNEEIQHEAENVRRGKFFRAMALQYL